ncbi:MAG: hypothetical protein U5L72_09945 [Bacteroidales bacterium]|nr:hypothetical protein [Bacteroidales bacterium]
MRPDLMTYDAYQLCFIIKLGKNTAGKVNESAGNCKGVHHRGVNYLNMVFKVRTMRELTHLIAPGLNKGLELRVIIHPEGSQYLRVIGETESHLLWLRS